MGPQVSPARGGPGPTSQMAAEIAEIPAVVARLLDEGALATDRIAGAIRAARPRWVSVAARGTSDHAGIYARYLIETHLRLPVAMAAPAVTTVYGARLDWRDALLLAVSQSGESPDVVAVTRAAREGGALTVSVTNEPTSPLAQAAEHTLPCHAGPERAVAATKTYVAQLTAIAALVARLADGDEIEAALPATPAVLAACLAAAPPWLDAAAPAFAAADRCLVVSRGYDLATALEVALKLKETSQVFAEGYSTADLLHGPVALAAPDVPLLAFRPDGRMGRAVDEACQRVVAAGAHLWQVGGRDLATRAGSGILALPLDLPEALSPLALVLPGQLLAERVARLRGGSPDAPTGLTKVTRTL